MKKVQRISISNWVIFILLCLSIFELRSSTLFLSIMLGSYLLLLETLINKEKNNRKYALISSKITLCTSCLIVLLNATQFYWYFIGLILLSLYPIVLFLTLVCYTGQKRNNTIKLILMLLLSGACWIVWCLWNTFYPEINFFVYYAVILLLCEITLIQTKQHFFNKREYRLFLISVPFSCLPVMVACSRLFYRQMTFHPSLFLLLLFPLTLLVLEKRKNKIYFNEIEKTLSLSAAVSIIFFICADSFFLMNDIAIEATLILTGVFVFILMIFTIFQLVQTRYTRLHHQQLSNEKMELLSQLSYAEFSQTISHLLLDNLKNLLNGQELSVVAYSKNKNMDLICQNGINIPISYLQQNIDTLTTQIKYHNQEYEVIQSETNSQILVMISKPIEKQTTVYSIKQILNRFCQLYILTEFFYEFQAYYLNQPQTIEENFQNKHFNQMAREKRRYSNYLHDTVLQSVIALNTLSSQLTGEQEIVDTIKLEFSKLIASIRQETISYSFVELYNMTLKDYLYRIIKEFNQKYPQTHFSLEYSLIDDLTPFMTSPICRMVKELNENIGKHAYAKKALTQIYKKRNSLIIEVKDDGVGIEESQIINQKWTDKKNFGLPSIKNDVNWLGGTLSFDKGTLEKQGLVVTITLPINTDKEGDSEAITCG